MSEETPEVTGTMKVYSRKDVRKACDDFIRVMQLFNFGNRDEFAARLSLEEAVTNAIIHGNKEDPQKAAFIEYAVYLDRLVITVTDEGEGFDLANLPDCTWPENRMHNGGRGVCIITRLMDEAKYNEKGNSLTMVRHRDSDKGKDISE